MMFRKDRELFPQETKGGDSNPPGLNGIPAFLHGKLTYSATFRGLLNPPGMNRAYIIDRYLFVIDT